MKLSRSNKLFGLTGLFLATIGLVYFLNGGERTSMIQAMILLCSGSSLLIIAVINILIDLIINLYRRFYNPLNKWSLKRKASIFNYKG